MGKVSSLKPNVSKVYFPLIFIYYYYFLSPFRQIFFPFFPKFLSSTTFPILLQYRQTQWKKKKNHTNQTHNETHKSNHNQTHKSNKKTKPQPNPPFITATQNLEPTNKTHCSPPQAQPLKPPPQTKSTKPTHPQNHRRICLISHHSRSRRLSPFCASLLGLAVVSLEPISIISTHIVVGAKTRKRCTRGSEKREKKKKNWERFGL